jgi:hypothetical protein
VPPVRPANRRDVACVPRRRKPVVNRRADRASPDRRLPRAMMAGDQQENAVAARDRLLERAIDCTPGAVETHPVKIYDPVGLDRAAAKSPVPAAVERAPMVVQFLRGTRR